MTALLVMGIIVLILLGISMVRVGASADYSDGGLTARVRVGPLGIPVYPPKKKPEAKEARPPRTEKPAARPPAKQPAPLGEKLSLVRRIIPVACRAAGRLKRKVRIDRLEVKLITAGGADAARGAIQFGQAAAALANLKVLLENSFQMKEYRFYTNVDFSRTEPEVCLRGAVSMTVGQCAALGVRTGAELLRVYLRHQKESGRRAAQPAPAAAGKE